MLSENFRFAGYAGIIYPVFSGMTIQKEANMPNFNRQGPQFMGPKTGRGAGCCNRSGGQFAGKRGMGRGQGMGMGAGVRGMNFPAGTPAGPVMNAEDGLNMLRSEAEQTRNRLNAIIA